MHDAKKRKGSELSSELDSSVNSPAKIEAKKPKKKKPKPNSDKIPKVLEKDQSEEKDKDVNRREQKDRAEINRQLSDINRKLSNVITRDDGFLRGLIRETNF